MVEFLLVHWKDIVLVLVAVVGALWMYKNGKKDLLRKMALSLVVQAEKALGSGTGALKKAMVIERFYNALPFLLKVLLTQQDIDKFIEDALNAMEKYLSDNQSNLLSYEEEIRHQVDELRSQKQDDGMKEIQGFRSNQ